MGACCGTANDAHDPTPMRGDQVMGKHGGVAITRDEQRAKAAAAAEARAQANQTRGQQGPTSKIKPRAEVTGGRDALSGGLNDPRVQYWEPTKWAQVLRERVPNGREVLLKMDMAAGHFSANDRYKKLAERSFEYAWLLEQLGRAG